MILKCHRMDTLSNYYQYLIDFKAGVSVQYQPTNYLEKRVRSRALCEKGTKHPEERIRISHIQVLELHHQCVS